MKKFTKVLSLLLAGLLCSACLLSCDEDDISSTTPVVTTAPDTADDPASNGTEVTDSLTQENVFTKVSERMSRLKSYSMNAEMKMDMSMMGMTIAATIGMDAAVDAEGKRYYAETSTQMLGQSATVINYYDNEIYYIEAEGEKMYADMDAEMLESLLDQENGASELDSSYFESFKLYSSDDGYLLQISGLKDGSNLLDSITNADMLAGLSVDLSDVKIEMSITKDYCISEMKLTMSMSMNMDEALDEMGEIQVGDVSASIEMTATYSDFDSAADKIVKPDLTGAEKFDLKDLIGSSDEDRDDESEDMPEEVSPDDEDVSVEEV